MYFGLEFLTVTLCAQLTTAFSLLREDLKNMIPNNKDVLNTSGPNASTNVIENIIKEHQKHIE